MERSEEQAGKTLYEILSIKNLPREGLSLPGLKLQRMELAAIPPVPTEALPEDEDHLPRAKVAPEPEVKPPDNNPSIKKKFSREEYLAGRKKEIERARRFSGILASFQTTPETTPNNNNNNNDTVVKTTRIRRSSIKSEDEIIPRTEVEAFPKSEVEIISESEKEELPKSTVETRPKSEVETSPKSEVQPITKSEIETAPKSEAETSPKSEIQIIPKSEVAMFPRRPRRKVSLDVPVKKVTNLDVPLRRRITNFDLPVRGINNHDAPTRQLSNLEHYLLNGPTDNGKTGCVTTIETSEDIPMKNIFQNGVQDGEKSATSPDVSDKKMGNPDVPLRRRITNFDLPVKSVNNHDPPVRRPSALELYLQSGPADNSKTDYVTTIDTSKNIPMQHISKNGVQDGEIAITTNSDGEFSVISLSDDNEEVRGESVLAKDSATPSLSEKDAIAEFKCDIVAAVNSGRKLSEIRSHENSSFDAEGLIKAKPAKVIPVPVRRLSKLDIIDACRTETDSEGNSVDNVPKQPEPTNDLNRKESFNNGTEHTTKATTAMTLELARTPFQLMLDNNYNGHLRGQINSPMPESPEHAPMSKTPFQDFSDRLQLRERADAEVGLETNGTGSAGPSQEKRTGALLAAFVACLDAAALGTVIGYASPAIPDINSHPNPFHLDSIQQMAWVASMIALGEMVGGALSGPVLDRYGRKMVIIANTVPFVIGWMIIAAAPNVDWLFVGRFLTGFCAGVVDVAVPVYLAEVSPADIRGFVGSCYELFVNLGIFFVFGFGCVLSYNWLAIACAFVPTVMMILMCFMPETPRFLMAVGNQVGAKQALVILRGEKADVSQELNEIVDTINQSSGKVEWRDFIQPTLYKPLYIVLGLMLIQQFSGYGVVYEYTVIIFSSAGIKLSPNVQSAIVGLSGVVSNLVSAFVVDRTGRKGMLYVSAGIMAVCMAAMGAFFIVKDYDADFALGYISWLPILSLVGYNFGLNIGFGPIPFYMAGELFPLKTRGITCGICIAIWSLFFFLVSRYFMELTIVVKDYGAYWILSGVSLLAIVFVLTVVPETKGKTLEEIERGFRS